MRIFSAFRYSEWSLKRKLFGYMFLLATLLLLALVTGLFLFGRFDSAGKNTYEALDIQLEVFEKDVPPILIRLPLPVSTSLKARPSFWRSILPNGSFHLTN